VPEPATTNDGPNVDASTNTALCHAFPMDKKLMYQSTMVKLAKLLNMKVDWFETKGLDMVDLSSYFEWAEQNKMVRLFKDAADTIQPMLDSIRFSNHMRLMLSKR